MALARFGEECRGIRLAVRVEPTQVMQSGGPDRLWHDPKQPAAMRRENNGSIGQMLKRDDSMTLICGPALILAQWTLAYFLQVGVEFDEGVFRMASTYEF